MPNLKTALTEAVSLLKNITDTPVLDAEVLLLNVLDKNRSYLRTWSEQELTPEQHAAYHALISNRKSGQPIAYLTGKREFWSRDFNVTPDVLIPRPETELLIELSLAILPANQSSRILDLGTGSGIIAVTLAAERPRAQVSAADISPNALQVAIDNAKLHHVENIQFYVSNWCENLPHGEFDLILSNPPYIAEDDEHLQQGDLCFEPKTALISPERGLKDIRIIAENSLKRLIPGGCLMVEHGYNQQEEILSLFHFFGYKNIKSHTDLSGQPRVTSGLYLPST
ncbi:MAG: peptide chain release factor N(5)-glutamine methyltransferase [Methylococcaceae bacterium]|nr:peptide chain release factor N(5)-glutamine methyltransferase [Methylococcaceae bacterium]